MYVWCCCRLIIAMSLVHCSNQGFLSESLESAPDPSQLLIDEVRNLYIDFRSLVYLFEATNDDDIVDQLIGDHPFYSVQITPNLSGAIEFNADYEFAFNDDVTFEQSKLYVYQAHDPQGMTNALAVMKRLYFYRIRDQVLVVMNEGIDHVQVVKAVQNSMMANVIFGYPNGSIFTFDRMEQRNWFEVTDGEYFYNKFANFHKSEIRISFFSHVRDAIPNKYDGFYSGRDGRMSKTFMEVLNATGIYVPPTDKITYGENRGNGNITGVFADVAHSVTNIALNSRLMKPEFENVVEYSYPHGRDDLIVLVPCGTGGSTIEYYKSFAGLVWLSILVFNSFCFIVFVQTKTFDRISTALLYTFGIFFGQSFSRSKTTIGRVLVLMYTFYSFLILVHYSSLLMSIITVPHKPTEINTFEELAESGLKMYTVERYKRYLTTYGEESVRKLKNRIFIRSEKQVTDLIDAHGDYAVICKRSVADWAVLNRRNFRNGSMVHRIMKKSPFPAIVCYIIKYGSSLKLSLNIFVMRIVESGIQDFWLATTLNQIFCEENQDYHLEDYREKKIALDELLPIFIIYLVGMVTSSIIFVGELLYKYYSSRSKSKNTSKSNKHGNTHK